MRRFLKLGLCLLLAACGGGQPDMSASSLSAVRQSLPSKPVQCRIGPHDGPVLAERGIGGTGLPAMLPAFSGSAAKTGGASATDRGVSGTGLPAKAAAPVSTGIAGEITGFASICVNGVEVKYNSATPVLEDGAPARDNALRAGQVVAIKASEQSDALWADEVTIRHEVVGPVSAVGLGQLTVAGQMVLVGPTTRGTLPAQSGVWVAVSGLRRPDGMIDASRIDLVQPGPMLLHGTVDYQQGHFIIGAQILAFPASIAAPSVGSAVTVTGRLRRGVLLVSSLKSDFLYSNPSAYFGATAKMFLLQAYGTYLGNTVTLPGGLQAEMPAGMPFSAGGQPAIFAIKPEKQGEMKLSGACIFGPGCGAGGTAVPNLSGISGLNDAGGAGGGMPAQPPSGGQDFGMGHAMQMGMPDGMGGFGAAPGAGQGGGGFGQPPR